LNDDELASLTAFAIRPHEARLVVRAIGEDLREERVGREWIVAQRLIASACEAQVLGLPVN
jgi:hypothetical protein